MQFEEGFVSLSLYKYSRLAKPRGRANIPRPKNTLQLGTTSNEHLPRCLVLRTASSSILQEADFAAASTRISKAISYCHFPTEGMVINCKVQTGTSQGRAKGHKKKRNRYCQAMKLLTIAVVFFCYFFAQKEQT